MNGQTCANCGASLPATGTFCLACNTPVAGASRGLSVAEPEPAQVGRRWWAGLGAVVTVGLVVGLAYGLYAVVRPHPAKDILSATKNAIGTLVRAEGGTPTSCEKAVKYLAGSPTTTLGQCRSIFDHDPGARLTAARYGTPTVSGDNATLGISGTVVDHAGEHGLAATVSLSNASGTWLVVWDGKPLG